MGLVSDHSSGLRVLGRRTASPSSSLGGRHPRYRMSLNSQSSQREEADGLHRDPVEAGALVVLPLHHDPLEVLLDEWLPFWLLALPDGLVVCSNRCGVLFREDGLEVLPELSLQSPGSVKRCSHCLPGLCWLLTSL